jgi:High potential iron-sulfur protein
MFGLDRRQPPFPQIEPPDGPISRRELFPAVVGFAAIVAAAVSLAKSQPAQAQSKTDKKTAKYQVHPNKGQACAQCRYFQPPNACQLVAGDISPAGWCSFFAKKG